MWPPEHEPFRANCDACPRLAAGLEQLRSSFPDYHCAPVGAWGNRRARLLIVGLAPGLHGANRTGRPFTGDSSGETLFAALERAGFASRESGPQVRLQDCRITNAVRCVPPGNRPATDELRRCRRFLADDITTLWSPRVRTNRCIVALGGLAFGSTRKALEVGGRFAHGAAIDVHPRLRLMASYHPSRLNTNTGRLTTAMLAELFMRARTFLD